MPGISAMPEKPNCSSMIFSWRSISSSVDDLLAI